MNFLKFVSHCVRSRFSFSEYGAQKILSPVLFTLRHLSRTQWLVASQSVQLISLPHSPDMPHVYLIRGALICQTGRQLKSSERDPRKLNPRVDAMSARKLIWIHEKKSPLRQIKPTFSVQTFLCRSKNGK